MVINYIKRSLLFTVMALGVMTITIPATLIQADTIQASTALSDLSPTDKFELYKTLDDTANRTPEEDEVYQQLDAKYTTLVNNYEPYPKHLKPTILVGATLAIIGIVYMLRHRQKPIQMP